MEPPAAQPPDVVSAGYLLLRGAPAGADAPEAVLTRVGSAAASPRLEFLLMQHADRWDLPKGHVDAGESIEQAAARELLEETGIATSELWTDPAFRFEYRYDIQRRGQTRRKLLVIFLGWLGRDRPLQLTEHIGYRWLAWSPPHAIQPQTIDPLLDALAKHLAAHPDWPGQLDRSRP